MATVPTVAPIDKHTRRIGAQLDLSAVDQHLFDLRILPVDAHVAPARQHGHSSACIAAHEDEIAATNPLLHLLPFIKVGSNLNVFVRMNF